MDKKRKVAIFDIDGTVFRSSLVIELVERLIEEGIFPEEARSEYAPQYEAWLNREGEYEEYVDALVRTFVKHLKGVHYGEVVEASDLVMAEHRYRVYRYTRNLIGELKTQGYFLLGISQSPKTVLDRFGRTFAFDKLYGRLYELGPSDRFTGKVVDEHLIMNKANIVHRAMEKEQLTLAGSVGVGDTEGDIPFLELVETPICFNPNMTLYRHARRCVWKIVVERKDVIYEL